MKPEYLGDGVYVQLDDYGCVVITTGSHLLAEATNQIVLELEVVSALTSYLKRLNNGQEPS